MLSKRTAIWFMLLTLVSVIYLLSIYQWENSPTKRTFNFVNESKMVNNQSLFSSEYFKSASSEVRKKRNTYNASNLFIQEKKHSLSAVSNNVSNITHTNSSNRGVSIEDPTNKFGNHLIRNLAEDCLSCAEIINHINIMHGNNLSYAEILAVIGLRHGVNEEIYSSTADLRYQFNYRLGLDHIDPKYLRAIREYEMTVSGCLLNSKQIAILGGEEVFLSFTQR